MNAVDVVRKAIERYGPEKQLWVAVEELSELQKELCKSQRGPKPNYKKKDGITEEIADVLIMISQMQLIFSITNEEVTDKMTEKLERLEKRMEEEK